MWMMNVDISRTAAIRVAVLRRCRAQQLMFAKRTLAKCRSGGSTRCKRPPRLQEVGKFEEILKNGEYRIGQCFLHRIFAYRGVILFPWRAQVVDRGQDEKTKNSMYYQVLMDERDFKYANTHSKMAEFSRKTPHARFGIAGLDHVSHDDIIPYASTEKGAIRHSQFDRFFALRKGRGGTGRTLSAVPKLSLEEWKRRHLPWLKRTRVNRMTTEKVRITAAAFYMGRRRMTRWWRYSIRIENLGPSPILIKGQRWGIYTGKRRLEAVHGLGILRNLPILSDTSPAIQYSSHVSLVSARGQMWGYYHAQKQPSGETFLCPVPSFSLESSLRPEPLTGANFEQS